MVGLVIVSHSRELANALVALVKQVASPKVPIAIAAGVGDNREEFGTDAVEISEAITSVFSPDGVLVLMDLGSAVLSAQMALELLPPEMGSLIRFCAAPLIEGSIAAAVQIGLDNSLDVVYEEAQQALLPKREQLGDSSDTKPVEQTLIAEHSRQLILTLHNLHGLHARPAARFVQTVASFNADVTVANLSNGKGPVSARSLNAVATLGAVEEHQIRITASGPEADAALEAIKNLINDNFGEKTNPQPAAPTPGILPAESQPATDGSTKAVPISDGIAVGPLYRYQPQLPPISHEPAQNPESEWTRLEQAIAATSQAIRLRHQQLKASIGESEASIFEAHLLILQDPDLGIQARNAIFGQHQNAEKAWSDTIAQVAASYRTLDDAYLQQRAVDVEDVGNQVLFSLAGKATSAPIAFTEPVILFAQDLTPTETAQLDMTKILGIITVGGGPTSHSAILARALGIPAISNVNPTMEHLPVGTPVALDGFNGKVWVNPESMLQAELEARREAWLDSRQKLLQTSHTPATTRDGRHVEVFANVGNLQDAQNAVKNGADGIGLLRTEFLFLTRETPPSEAEQLTVLQKIGSAMGGRAITVRTLDVGGDKEVPYIQLPPEANPFLGVRAIRMSLRNTDLFMIQLRAILRAAAEYPLRVMFPMIANVDEVRQARAWLEKAHQQLADEKLPHAWPMETGIMVEIPSAALLSPILAREVDFFSIGTNDLTQYTLAAERGNPLLSDMADALHPAVLQLIAKVVEAAHAEGKWVGVCGELAGNPLAVPVLLGLGVDELSLNSNGIPLTKSIIRAMNTSESLSLAKQILKTENVSEVRKLSQSFLDDHQAANIQ
jgi:multiphosphoryl transfer protein